MSPSLDQTQPQNPAPVDTDQQPKQECKEEVPTPKPEQLGVKEVPERKEKVREEPFVDRPSMHTRRQCSKGMFIVVYGAIARVLL